MLIGRKEELKTLHQALIADESKFVAIYGRRRVGKTFLVREAFNNDFAFYHTGLANETNHIQLAEFNRSLASYSKQKQSKLKDWYDAFDRLGQLLAQSTIPKKVVFIDEMPWMDSPRSNFLSALEHFWNGWASARKDILLIVCGSATSWIINKVIKNHGGLHNRVSVRIHLKPFCLRECELYSEEMGLRFNRRQVLEGYMIMGGVPFYWSQLKPGMSLAQNINQLFFSEDGNLRHEFEDLYDSLFKQPKPYLSIVDALATKKVGMTRTEILRATKLTDNGKLTEYLENVEQIKAKLGIQGVITTVYSWSVAGSKEKPGAQIDLLIDRNDDVINLCEIKYSKAPFQITNTIDASLQNKRERFIQETGTEKAVHLTMITTMGLSDNPYAWDVQSVVTMDDLFVL